MNRRERNRRLDEVYAEIPAMNCKGECADSCGPIDMTRAEHARIKERIGHRVPTCKGDSVDDVWCPLLTPGGRCSVYSVRPAICRLWGITEAMACPRGCVPEGGHWTDEQGFHWLLRIAEAVGERPDVDSMYSTRPGWFRDLQRAALEQHQARGGSVAEWLEIARPR